MAMTERVAKLRQQSLDARPSISAERAALLTDFYQSQDKLLSVPMVRALAFRHLMEHKTLYLGEGELIVGEKGPAPKAVPTYPELCCHSLQDLDILDTRPKTSFAVSADVKKVYEDKVIPYWEHRSMREPLLTQMTEEWMSAYDAGIFTESGAGSPGHTVLMTNLPPWDARLPAPDR